jgi:ectoine hydroxylase-related dioxygenase (phytanoyl-CoA dioxygenase family)
MCAAGTDTTGGLMNDSHDCAASATKTRLTPMPDFVPVSRTHPGEDAIQSFEENGVVCLRDAIPPEWVDAVSRGMEVAQERNDLGKATTVRHPGEPGYLFMDTFMWKRIDEFDGFFRESPAADLTMNLMRSRSLIFYFDFILIKEPGTSHKTPWHYDEAYWPITGTQMCNMWMVVEPTPLETTLRFVKGSHRWSKNYRMMSFDPYEDYPNPSDDPPVPDWDEMPGDHEIIYAALEPGDCVIFHNRTHHSAPGNSTKSLRRRALATHWIGDDIRFNNKPQTLDPPNKVGLVHGESMENEEFIRVR